MLSRTPWMCATLTATDSGDAVLLAERARGDAALHLWLRGRRPSTASRSGTEAIASSQWAPLAGAPQGASQRAQQHKCNALDAVFVRPCRIAGSFDGSGSGDGSSERVLLHVAAAAPAGPGSVLVSVLQHTVQAAGGGGAEEQAPGSGSTIPVQEEEAQAWCTLHVTVEQGSQPELCEETAKAEVGQAAEEPAAGGAVARAGELKLLLPQRQCSAGWFEAGAQRRSSPSCGHATASVTALAWSQDGSCLAVAIAAMDSGASASSGSQRGCWLLLLGPALELLHKCCWHSEVGACGGPGSPGVPPSSPAASTCRQPAGPSGSAAGITSLAWIHAGGACRPALLAAVDSGGQLAVLGWCGGGPAAANGGWPAGTGWGASEGGTGGGSPTASRSRRYPAASGLERLQLLSAVSGKGVLCRRRCAN
jgi:hypothetical protein